MYILSRLVPALTAATTFWTVNEYCKFKYITRRQDLMPINVALLHIGKVTHSPGSHSDIVWSTAAVLLINLS